MGAPGSSRRACSIPGSTRPRPSSGSDLFDVWGDDQPCPEPQRQDAVVVPPQGALGAVTVDGEGTGHLLFASPVGAPPVLNYSQWSQTLSSPEPVDAVVPLSQSVALLGNGPVVVYTREAASPALVVRWRDPAGGGACSISVPRSTLAAGARGWWSISATACTSSSTRRSPFPGIDRRWRFTICVVRPLKEASRLSQGGQS